MLTKLDGDIILPNYCNRAAKAVNMTLASSWHDLLCFHRRKC